MAIGLQGADKLINRLAKLSEIEAKEIINEVAKDVENSIKAKAQSFSDSGYQYIGTAEERNYGSSYYVDVGIKNDSAPFDLWKGLYYHNYGYSNWGWGGRFKGMQMTPHVMWFNDAVNSLNKEALTKIKNKVKAEIQEINRG